MWIFTFYHAGLKILVLLTFHIFWLTSGNWQSYQIHSHSWLYWRQWVCHCSSNQHKKQFLIVNSTVKTSAWIMPLEVMHAILKQVESHNFLEVHCKVLWEDVKLPNAVSQKRVVTSTHVNVILFMLRNIMTYCLQNCIGLLGTTYTSLTTISQYIGNFVIQYQPWN